MTDGRNIDARMGTLSGEGSGQRVTEESLPATVGEPGKPGDISYYGRPVIKKSPWSWDIPAYYYVGGTTGGVMTLGAAATLINRDALANLVSRSRWMGTAGAAISAILLIHDLGRPSRFLHMLRVFRPTSPMSVGTYILVTFSSLTGFSAVMQLAPRRFQWLGDTAAFLGGIFGLALSGYTGVLVANTAVPVWHQPHRLMPVLFLASGAASAASLFDLMEGTPQERKAAAIFGKAGKLVECGTALMIEREVSAVPEVVRPLREGVSGFLWRSGQLMSAASLAVSFFSERSVAARRLAGILGTAGAISLRFGIHYAGQRSATNPLATFHQQREGRGGFAVTGKRAVTGPEAAQ